MRRWDPQQCWDVQCMRSPPASCRGPHEHTPTPYTHTLHPHAPQEDSLKRTEEALSSLAAQRAEVEERQAAVKQQQEQREQQVGRCGVGEHVGAHVATEQGRAAGLGS